MEDKLKKIEKGTNIILFFYRNGREGCTKNSMLYKH